MPQNRWLYVFPSNVAKICILNVGDLSIVYRGTEYPQPLSSRHHRLQLLIQAAGCPLIYSRRSNAIQQPQKSAHAHIYIFHINSRSLPLPPNPTSSNEQKMHKPEAVVQAYRAFVETFGGSFKPPPSSGIMGQTRLTPEDVLQQKRARDLSNVREVYNSFITCYRYIFFMAFIKTNFKPPISHPPPNAEIKFIHKLSLIFFYCSRATLLPVM